MKKLSEVNFVLLQPGMKVHYKHKHIDKAFVGEILAVWPVGSRPQLSEDIIAMAKAEEFVDRFQMSRSAVDKNSIFVLWQDKSCTTETVASNNVYIEDPSSFHITQLPHWKETDPDCIYLGSYGCCDAFNVPCFYDLYYRVSIIGKHYVARYGNGGLQLHTVEATNSKDPFEPFVYARRWAEEKGLLEKKKKDGKAK